MGPHEFEDVSSPTCGPVTAKESAATLPPPLQSQVAGTDGFSGIGLFVKSE